LDRLSCDGWSRRSLRSVPLVMRRLFLLTVCLLLPFCAAGVAAQGAGNSLSSSAVTRITAVVRGSISVSVKNVPLRFDYDPERSESNRFAVPVSTTWNVNPQEVRSVEVIGYFFNRSRALVSEDELTVLPASGLMGSLNAGAFQRFDQANSAGPAGGSLSLFSEKIDHTNSRHTRNDILEMRIDTASQPDLEKSIYTGVLIIEVRQL
jgi:hypothetical protein